MHQSEVSGVQANLKQIGQGSWGRDGMLTAIQLRPGKQDINQPSQEGLYSYEKLP